MVTYIEHGELVQDSAEFLIERVLGELDLAHIEIPYTTDFEISVDYLESNTQCLRCINMCMICTYRRCLTLRLGQHNVQKLRCCGNRGNRL